MIYVKYIGGNIAGVAQKWGGTCATNYALLKAMEVHPEFVFEAKFRKDFPGLLEIRRFLEGADVTHVDDTLIVARMFDGGIPAPDIIGPITRSPLKDYQGWHSPYTADWFYQARVIRLNYAEENGNRHLVKLIRHGVDTDRLRPREGAVRRYVLWAGIKERLAKNYQLMQEIVQGLELPAGYEFRVLSDYPVQDYWTLLDETAILVNTSRCESFCCAAFEAMAKGVPVIWRQGLQGGVHEAAGVRVGYEAGEYRAAILAALSGESYRILGQAAREYCETNASLAVMGDDLVAVYREALEKKRAEAEAAA